MEKPCFKIAPTGVEELAGSVMAFIETHNKAKALVGRDNLEKAKRGRERLDKL